MNLSRLKIPTRVLRDLYGLVDAIKKEGSSRYLADLQKIRKAYVQDVKENYPINRVPQFEEKSNGFDKNSLENSSDRQNALPLDEDGISATKMKKEKGREVSALKFVKLIYARLALMSATQARTFSISSAETLERNLKGSPPSI